MPFSSEMKRLWISAMEFLFAVFMIIAVIVGAFFLFILMGGDDAP